MERDLLHSHWNGRSIQTQTYKARPTVIHLLVPQIHVGDLKTQQFVLLILLVIQEWLHHKFLGDIVDNEWHDCGICDRTWEDFRGQGNRH